MSWGVDDEEPVVGLRAMAHPTRLRMLSLLTGAAMTTAEMARELDIAHASASYHLRQLHAAGLVEIAGEERIRGGRAIRYRHAVGAEARGGVDAESQLLLWRAVADELLRRSRLAAQGGERMLSDAELWVDPVVWNEAVEQCRQAVQSMHEAAQPARTQGTARVSVTVGLFTMVDQ